jgi:hypothetical protein
MTALTAWIHANPELAAMLAPLVGSLFFVVWSAGWRAIGLWLDGRWPRLAKAAHLLATRTPPTSKAEALAAAKDAVDAAR